jgi:hypothetical protein
MAISRDQVRELLGSGLSNEVVASAVGCEPSYITQLMSDENFANEVVALRSANLTANNKRDRSIDKIEDRLIEKVGQAIEENLIYKPLDLVKVFAVLNNAKRRGVPAHESLVINKQVVNLSIPGMVVNNFTMNQQKEVVEINVDGKSQTMVTMPAHQLLQTLAKDAGETNVQGGKYTRVASFLPTAALQLGSKDTSGD